MQVQWICYKVQAFVLVFLKSICWGGEWKSLNYLLKALCYPTHCFWVS